MGGDLFHCQQVRLYTRDLESLVQTHRTHAGKRSVNLSEHERLKQLERENTELKRANEILRKAAAFFAQAELDRKPN